MTTPAYSSLQFLKEDWRQIILKRAMTTPAERSFTIFERRWMTTHLKREPTTRGPNDLLQFLKESGWQSILKESWQRNCPQNTAVTVTEAFLLAMIPV
jgi:hypothetical protein